MPLLEFMIHVEFMISIRWNLMKLLISQSLTQILIMRLTFLLLSLYLCVSLQELPFNATKLFFWPLRCTNLCPTFFSSLFRFTYGINSRNTETLANTLAQRLTKLSTITSCRVQRADVRTTAAEQSTENISWFLLCKQVQAFVTCWNRCLFSPLVGVSVHSPLACKVTFLSLCAINQKQLSSSKMRFLWHFSPHLPELNWVQVIFVYEYVKRHVE